MVSKNEKAEKIMGLRGDGVALDHPSELGFACPVGYKHPLEWSEYNCFIWCKTCNFDYPSCLCVDTPEKATDIFLDSVRQARSYDD